MTSITSYYSMLGQESSAPWINQSDQTYGTVGDGYWRYSDANDAYEAKPRSTINASPASRGEPNSLQWEFEFGGDAIIYTIGGNDNSSTTNGESTRRVIFGGKFDYQNNDVTGDLLFITTAKWGNPRKVNGIDEPLSQTEEITAYLPISSPLRINSFNDINERYQQVNNGSFTVIDWEKRSSTQAREQIFDYIPLFQEQWLNDDWYNDPLNDDILAATSNTNEESRNDDKTNNKILRRPIQFNKKSADKITNFNPLIDTFDIDADSFGIDSSATFTVGKNKKTVKKNLAKQDFDFLYDQKKGGLYFNENGSDKGFGDGGIVAILKGSPDLTSSNLEFI